MIENAHPVEELFALRQQIARLTGRAAELESYLLERAGPSERVGALHYARPETRRVRELDPELLPREVLEEPAHYRTIETIAVQIDDLPPELIASPPARAAKMRWRSQRSPIAPVAMPDAPLSPVLALASDALEDVREAAADETTVTILERAAPQMFTSEDTPEAEIEAEAQAPAAETTPDTADTDSDLLILEKVAREIEPPRDAAEPPMFSEWDAKESAAVDAAASAALVDAINADAPIMKAGAPEAQKRARRDAQPEDQSDPSAYPTPPSFLLDTSLGLALS